MSAEKVEILSQLIVVYVMNQTLSIGRNGNRH